MARESEIQRLRIELDEYRRLSTRSGWLLRRLGLKIRYFPRDLGRRLRRSLHKRKMRGETSIVWHGVEAVVKDPSPTSQILVAPGKEDALRKLHGSDPVAKNFLEETASFIRSDAFDELVSKALALDPNIGSPPKQTPSVLAPWHDGDYFRMRQLLDRLPEGPFENVVLMPFGKLGGSDFVAGVLCHALSECGRTIILRTEQSDWARPDWYPEDVATIDLSEEFDALQNPIYALYVLLQTLAPRRVYNVNSRLAFETLSRYGRRLARQCELYAYYFCADRDEDGIEAGYPVWYFAGLLPHLTAALVDSLDLTLTLRKRYALPTQLGNKISTVYTPAMQPIPDDPVSRAQIANRQERETPRILWAGRLDRQKRFDILVDVATAMPDVEFLAWGKAVLDKPPSLSGLPKNLKLQEPFSNYDELPLDHCDGWLYTADWDGMPTILIECAAIGMPIVASAVGGIPELIDETTGWPVPSGLEAEAYVVALRDMLSDTDEALKRSSALQRRTRERHNMATYRRQILALQSEE